MEDIGREEQPPTFRFAREFWGSVGTKGGKATRRSTEATSGSSTLAPEITYMGRVAACYREVAELPTDPEARAAACFGPDGLLAHIAEVEVATVEPEDKD